MSLSLFSKYATVLFGKNVFPLSKNILSVSSYVKPYIPEILPETRKNLDRNVRKLPRSYERVFQIIPPTTESPGLPREMRRFKFKLNPRKMKNNLSYEAQMSNPKGQLVVHRRLVKRQYPLWDYED